MIKLLGWTTLIGLGLYFHIIQSILLFGAMALGFISALLGGGVVTIN